MAYLQSNIPYFKAWVRREYTCNFERYEGEKVFYASRNKGTIKGVERASKGKLMRGKNKKPGFIVMIAIGEAKKKKKG